MSGELTVPAFLDQLRASNLLDDAQLDELAGCPEAGGDSPNRLAKVILRRGWLTRFQLKTIAAGRGQDLTVGPYVLLDRIGEGGMGTVYKARHQHMQRIVALKMIRKERLSNPNALRRFYQEMKLAGQLHHPNIVLAYDAGPAGTTHYVAMEYVEGISLSRLIIEQGPPPVAQACEYIRQAALGLQHAHEKGLVHRDIKPGNLIVSRAPPSANGAAPRDVVKLLDLGLARLQGHGGDTGVTRDGVVLGTPDYLAPEQAMNSHTVDVRADLYSLGCTFYFLLTGRPPFHGAALTELLIKHQMEKPATLDRHGVKAPAGVQAVLDRLLAKDPADRYQTPGELAEELAPYCSAAGLGSETFRSVAPREPSGDGEWPTLIVEGKKERADDEDDRTLAGEGTVERPRPTPRRVDRAARRRRVRRMIAVGGAVPVVSLIVLAGVLYVKFGRPSGERSPGPAATSLVAGEPRGSSPRGDGSGRANGGARPVLPPDRGGSTKKEEKPPIVPPPTAVRVVAGPGKVLLPAPEHVMALALSPDGKRVAFGTTGVRVWDVEKGKQLHDCEGNVFIVKSLAWSPDGRQLLVGGARGLAKLLDARTGQEVKSFVGHHTDVHAVAFSADGRYVLTGSGAPQPQAVDGKVVYDEAEVRRWEVETGHQVGRYRGPTGPVSAVAFSADGKRVLAAPGFPDDGTVYDWDAERADVPRRFSLPPAEPRRAFSPDGREFALLGRDDHLLHVYDVATGQESRRSGPLPPAFCLSWSRDGRTLVCGAAYFPEKKTGGTIHLLDAATCKEVRRFAGGGERLIALDAGPGGRHVISSADHAGVRLWDEEPGADPQ